MRRNSATADRAHKAFEIDMRNTVASAVGQRKRQLRTFRKGIKGYESLHTDRRYRGTKKLLTAKITCESGTFLGYSFKIDHIGNDIVRRSDKITVSRKRTVRQ